MSKIIIRENPERIVLPSTRPPKIVASLAGGRGPKGDPGGSYMHTQNTPVLVWTCQHNLGSNPAGIICFNDAGEEEVPGIAYSTANVTLLTFVEAKSGVAYFS